MPEAGGTTTQSGIHYQNSIAALYIGRLLDPRTRTASERVIEVRVEAPEYVDDIVVRHADGSCTYIQAKESISLASEEWNKLWKNFTEQAKAASDEKFRLILAIGTISKEIEQLVEVCNRAKGKQNHEEWYDSLSVALKAVANKIIKTLPENNTQAAFELVKFVEVWIWTLNMIERDWIHLWIPPSTLSTETLFDLLRGKVGGKARIREIFHTVNLLDELYKENNIKVHDVSTWGVDAYLKTIKEEMETLSVPGTRIRGKIDDLFFWIPLYDRSDDHDHFDFEEEDPRWRWDRQREIIDLKNFPYGTINNAVIDAGAGFGKTTMLHAIAYRLSSTVRVPVVISLDALVASNMTVLGYLNDKINTEYDVSIDWERLCESGRTVALFDGLDELSAADRTIILDRIIKFSARFPKSAYLLTVRDSSALTLPLGVTILALQRLDDSAIRQIAESYARQGASLSVNKLLNHLSCHPDLGHLLRIPLFLALALATIGPEDNLPNSRSELLEHYLSLLFSPERYKALAVSLNPLDDLREASELLAWRGLENNGVGFAETEASRLLRKEGLKEESNVYIERLVQIGVLQRKASRLRFTYPIIQEYLAACWLVTNAQNEIGPRFSNIYRRPWAQALQFAIEMHPKAETVIVDQLSASDDVFYTKLRLIARCIVNGTKVNNDIRKLVGDRLTTAWSSEAYAIRKSIGYLLADGFIDLLSQKAVEHILDWDLENGGAEIVVAKSSPSFTREILKKFIAKDLSYKSHLHGWQTAVDEIAEEALELYLERVSDENTTQEELDSLESLIVALSPSHLNPESWHKLVTNSLLPPIIRLAGYQLGPRPISSDAWLVIDDVIKLFELDEKNNSAYRAYKIFWHMQDAECKVMKLLNDDTVPEERIRFILDALIRSEMNEDDKRVMLRRFASVKNISENIVFLIFLCLAICGDKKAESDMISMLFDQDFRNVSTWLHQANKFCKKTVCDAAKILSSKPIDNEHLLDLINSADFGLSYKTESTIFDGVAANEPYIHPARGNMLSNLRSRLKDHDESLDSLIIQLQIGDKSVIDRLITEIRKFVASFQEFMPFDDDYKIRGALYYIERQSLSVPFDLLFQIIDKSSSNAGNAAVKWLVRNGDEKTILRLLEYYNSRENDFVREAIFSGLEILAGRYGICIIREGNHLIIS